MLSRAGIYASNRGIPKRSKRFVTIYAIGGRWYIEIDGKVHPRSFNTYNEAAAVAALVPEWMGN